MAKLHNWFTKKANRRASIEASWMTIVRVARMSCSFAVKTTSKCCTFIQLQATSNANCPQDILPLRSNKHLPLQFSSVLTNIHAHVSPTPSTSVGRPSCLLGMAKNPRGDWSHRLWFEMCSFIFWGVQPKHPKNSLKKCS